jgi:HlyD family secretion protein
MKRGLALLLVLAGCTSGHEDVTPVPVRQGAFVVDVRTPGVVEALDSHTVGLPQGVWGGNVEKLVPEGTLVKKGDFIARIANRQIYEQLLDKQDELAREERALEHARAEAPVKNWEVQQEIVDRRRGWHEKSLQEQATRRGGTPDLQAQARRDLTVVGLTLANDPLAVTERLYEEGVVAGQELARVKRDHDLAELEQRRAVLALAQLRPGAQREEVAKARLNASMARASFESAQLEAPAKREVIKLEQQKSRVRIRGLGIEVKALKAKVDATNLYAPSAGMLLYPMIWNWKKVHVGMQVWQGLTFLAVSRLDSVKIRGAVSEAEIARVKVGARAEITSDGYPGRVFTAKVASVSKLAKEEENRNGERTSGVKRFDVELRPEGRTPELKPNMRVSVRIISEALDGATSVPVEALFPPDATGDAARYVWVAGERGPVKTPVKPKLWGDDWVALGQALPAGARVYLLDPTRPLEAAAAEQAP